LTYFIFSFKISTERSIFSVAAIPGVSEHEYIKRHQKFTSAQTAPRKRGPFPDTKDNRQRWEIKGEIQPFIINRKGSDYNPA
jgi:hypothetical protein